MTAHTAPAPTPTTPATDPAWLALSAAMTWEVPVIADRDDLIVTIAPGVGHGAPACFIPSEAMIEIDGTHLAPVDPATATPHRTADRTRYAATWGLLTHECAHAAHSTWEVPPGTPADVAAAALLLEEPRIEAAQINRRPDDRHWLRSSAREIILNDTKADDPAHGPAMTPHAAAHTAALILGRADGGILNRRETAPVGRAVRDILGVGTLRKLRNIWRKALTVPDGDAAAMIALGRRWVDIIGPDPTTPPTGAPGAPGGAPAGPTPLADAINTTLAKVSRSVARETPPTDPTPSAPPADPATEAAARAAATVFGDGATTSGTRTTGTTTPDATRPPTPAETTAARALARALSTAGHRDRVATKTTSTTPPGRLRMRGALARQAQLAAGRIPTAEPFTRTTRKVVPTPPLRIAIACDVSGSMSAFAAPVASAAWILAHAARHTTVPAESATVLFGDRVRAITHPGTAPAKVTEFTATGSYEAIDEAIDALDGALGLARPGAARLLVIVSDGHYNPTPRAAAQKKLDRLRAAGCAVLWIGTGRNDKPLNGATLHVLADPTATATAIGQAATAALRAAR
ncbi:vWA domain-containing protein [Sphaerisporangium aureirubrum]|uniref:VWA domain-containing protein n=1 Tax=Sphaerisporangium aureirubrum TaxID=1544736 RepID=A0ABW1NDI1_9ACTN